MNKQEKSKIIKKYKKDLKEALTDLKTPGKRYKQIPNILTASRLLAPLAILPVAFVGNVPLTIALSAGFALTDCVDGAIARKYELQSELGADLDAVTDKVFVGTLLIAAAFFNPILLCNLGLEAVIAAINIKQKLSGNDTGSTTIGKYKTWAVFALAALGVVAPQIGISNFISTCALATSAMQGLTIGSYLTKYGKSDKMTKTPEIPKVVDNIIPDEIKLPDGRTVKAKQKEKQSDSDRLDELKKMREFFYEEQKNQQNNQTQQANIYQKTNNKKSD